MEGLNKEFFLKEVNIVDNHFELVVFVNDTQIPEGENDYDSKGALLFIAVVVCFYAISICFFIGSTVKKKGEWGDQKDIQNVTNYLVNVGSLREENQRDNFRKLKQSIMTKITPRRSSNITMNDVNKEAHGSFESHRDVSNCRSSYQTSNQNFPFEKLTLKLPNREKKSITSADEKSSFCDLSISSDCFETPVTDISTLSSTKSVNSQQNKPPMEAENVQLRPKVSYDKITYYYISGGRNDKNPYLENVAPEDDGDRSLSDLSLKNEYVLPSSNSHPQKKSAGSLEKMNDQLIPSISPSDTGNQELQKLHSNQTFTISDSTQLMPIKINNFDFHESNFRDDNSNSEARKYSYAFDELISSV